MKENGSETEVGQVFCVGDAVYEKTLTLGEVECIMRDELVQAKLQNRLFWSHIITEIILFKCPICVRCARG